MVAKVKTKTVAKKADAKSKKKATVSKPKKTVAPKVSSKNTLDLQSLDRKGLAARARLLKKELLAIRFNLQSPSLRDYRNKRKELASILSHLGSN